VVCGVWCVVRGVLVVCGVAIVNFTSPSASSSSCTPLHFICSA
jgi:hypothetical protein